MLVDRFGTEDASGGTVKNVKGAAKNGVARNIMGLKMFQRSLFCAVLVLIPALCPGQSKDSKEPAKQSQPKESEPPEEDDSAKPKEYAFNPLQAQKEMEVGDEYLKKGALGAAVARYIEATKWNPTLADAYLKLGKAQEKFKDPKAAKEAYSKYLQLAPEAKNAAEVRKKLAKM
jgi:tetratricopeptide (TPR) repeat protein